MAKTTKKDVEKVIANPTELFLESFAESLGYKLVKKETTNKTYDPQNASTLDEMGEDSLRKELSSVKEKVKLEQDRIREAKGKILQKMSKDGPNEFTAKFFSGDSVPIQRVDVHSKVLNELRIQEDYINRKLEDLSKIDIISVSDEAERLEVYQGNFGLALRLHLK